MMRSLLLLHFATSVLAQSGKRILVSNDDGWATAGIRAQYEALRDAGHDVILSAPAINLSGTGSLSTDPIIVLTGCEFDTCPALSPPRGSDPSDPRINYVNAFPVDAVKYGIRTLAPKFFNGGSLDLVISGPNVGRNLGIKVLGSGTVGAATEAAREGIPSIAVSGLASIVQQISYTTLETDPSSASTIGTREYGQLTLQLANALLAGSGPALPPGVSLNVNYGGTDGCPSASDFNFILTRIFSDSSQTDVETCGTTHLPNEEDVIARSGCFASVSVLDASSKLDVDATTQGLVLERLGSFLSCLPS